MSISIFEQQNKIDILEHENQLMRETLIRITNYQADESEWCETAEGMYWIAVECLREIGIKVKLK